MWCKFWLESISRLSRPSNEVSQLSKVGILGLTIVKKPLNSFLGCTLTKGKNEATWDPLETEEDVEHKLQLTSACLGIKAKDGERNLVEVTTANDNGDEVVCSIVSLRAGGNECMHLELGFNNPTKFKLREGSGPLSLCGTHLKASPLDMMDDEDYSDSEGKSLLNCCTNRKE